MYSGLFFSYAEAFSTNSWVNVDSSTTDMYIISKAADDAINYGRYQLQFLTNNTIAYFAHQADNAQIEVYSNMSVTDDTWFMVTTIYDGSGKMLLYVDGSLVGFTSIASFKDTGESPFRIGSQSGGAPANFLDGRVDEVGVWGRVLTTSEITQLYNEGDGMTQTTEYESYPTVTLNTPTDAIDLTTNIINFGGVVYDDINLVNVSLIINDVYNETNTSGINNSNQF